MTRVLVTGGGGFIGRWVLPLLARRGYEVHAVSRASCAGEGTGVVWHRADLLDASQTKLLIQTVRAERLLHLAWNVTPPDYRESAENELWLEAGAHLCRMFVEAGGSRMVGAGSCAELDWTGGASGVGTSATLPQSRYGRCKKQLGLEFARIARDFGISAAWCRLYFPYGPGEPASKLVSHMVMTLLQGRTAECEFPALQRDYLFVADAAFALAAVVAAEFTDTVDIGTGSAVSLGELSTTVAQMLGCPELVRLARGNPAGNDASVVVADIAGLRRYLPWVPGYTLEQGINATIAHCRNLMATHQGAGLRLR